MNYQISLYSFTIANKFQNDQSFSAHLLHLVKIQDLRIEANHLVILIYIQYYHHSDINILSTFHTAFLDLSHTQLTRYSTGDK